MISADILEMYPFGEEVDFATFRGDTGEIEQSRFDKVHEVAVGGHCQEVGELLGLSQRAPDAALEQTAHQR